MRYVLAGIADSRIASYASGCTSRLQFQGLGRVGGWAIAQLWLFWVAPIVGAVAAGALYKNFFEEEPKR